MKEVQLYGNIGFGGITAREFIAQLRSAGTGEVTVRIHSPGGDLWEGLAIYNAMLGMRNLTVCVDGLAGSMASICAMAAKRIQIAESAFFFLHNPWSELGGDAEDLRAQSDALTKFQSTMAEIYAKRTGADVATVSAWMDQETWFSAQEAVAVGLADEIVTAPAAIAASLQRFDLKRFRNTPNSLSDNEMKKLVNTLAELRLIDSAQATEDQIIAQVSARLRNDADLLNTALAQLDGVLVSAEVRDAIRSAAPNQLGPIVAAIKAKSEKEIKARANEMAIDIVAKSGCAAVPAGLDPEDSVFGRAEQLNQAAASHLEKIKKFHSVRK